MRRTMIALLLISVLSLAAGPACAAQQGGVNGRFDRPKAGFAPAGTELSESSPAEAGLAPEPIEAAQRQVAAWTQTPPGREHPMYAGAVSLLVHDGKLVSRQAIGHELRYSGGKGTPLPSEQQEEMKPDTVFDIASITKLFTSIAVLQQIDEGRVRLEAPVATYLPEFGVRGKESITVQQLLTHTSGLQAEAKLWKLPPEQRIPSIMSMAPENPPGTTYQYSDPNMITLGVLVERVAGAPLDQVVRERITEPLGMEDTGYNPPVDQIDRIAATEFQSDPQRGMVRGQPQDENAWALGGVAGQAGIFSTADDLAILGQAVLNGGTYGGERILRAETVDKMLTDYNAAFPGDSHGLGFELNQRWYMAGLSSPRTAGHTGFSGTSLVVDPLSRSVAVLLTNRVHPSREWGSNNPAREAVAQGLAQALAVRPPHGSKAWFTGAGVTPPEAMLTTDSLGEVAGSAQVSFDAFVDTQNDLNGVDPLTLESSVDNGATWQPVVLTASGPRAPREPQPMLAGAGHRAWWEIRGSVAVAHGQQLRLRWHYAPDPKYLGRGVSVDGISVSDRNGTLLDGEREPQRFAPRGWNVTNW